MQNNAVNQKKLVAAATLPVVSSARSRDVLNLDAWLSVRKQAQ